MKKLFSLLMILGVFAFGFNAVAQDDQDTTATAVEDTYPESPDYSMEDDATEEAQSFDQIIKDKFIEGDPTFMSPVLICLILGLAIAIERIISLNLSTTNTSKLLSKVEDALESGGVEAAKEVTKSTRG
ncbi:MAG: MotA/TolQ/ExbB proton channel family protein, partial [Cytophagia bacterium]|nr:MotA/TolQ/ExbB proton channel family protein [Cytophagia bacterium]